MKALDPFPWGVKTPLYGMMTGHDPHGKLEFSLKVLTYPRANK